MTAQLPSKEDVNNALFRLTTPLRGIIEKDSTALMDKVALEKIATHLTQITNAYCALLAAHEQEPVAWRIHTPLTSVTYVELNSKSVEKVRIGCAKENIEVVITPLYTHPAPSMLLAAQKHASGDRPAVWVRLGDSNHAPDCTLDHDEAREWEARGLEVLRMVAPAPAPVPAVPDEWRSSLQELVKAMRDYEMDVDEPAPYKHREMMRRAEALLNGGKS